MLEGWAFGLIQGMVYGVSSQELPAKEFDRYARTCSACGGLGGCLSLFFGALLFSMGGYFLPYFVLSGSFIVLAFIINASKVLDENPDALLEIEDEIMSFRIDAENNTDKSQKMNLEFAFSVSVSFTLCKN